MKTLDKPRAVINNEIYPPSPKASEGGPKSMKITIYTITDCQFSKQEKEYFQSHNLPFEEKNLETNREFLTEMLAVSNNFAGTPVTKMEKDDGQIVILKGFTKEDFDKALGFQAAGEKKPEEPKTAEAPAAAPAAQPVPAVAAPAPEAPVAQEPAPQPPVEAAPAPAQPETPANDPMASILNNLAQQAMAPDANAAAAPAVPAQPAAPPAGMPAIPDPQL